MPGSILILDDEQNYLLVLDAILSDAGYTVTALSDPEMGLAFLEESEVDVVVTDMKMPKLTGKEVLDHVKKHYPHIPVLIMTAFGSIEAAVEAMRTGAFDYITKPFSNEELLLSLSKAMQYARAQQENRQLRRQIQERFGPENIIARDKSMRHVLDMVHRAAPSRSTVLVTGESGTGKELIAKAIHSDSPRKDGPFVSVNCMALNPGVLESELFGHEKGSFTGAVSRRRGRFELADKGTLFIDEVGEMPLSMQTKFLRVLQEHTFIRVGGLREIRSDFRLVAATNRDLDKEVAAGNFRQDLFYRLSVVPVQVPPLRMRGNDAVVLAQHFLTTYARKYQRQNISLSRTDLLKISSYPWPGNVRELENVIERAVILAGEGPLELSLGLPGPSESAPEDGQAPAAELIADWPTLNELERRYIKLVLEQTGGQVYGANGAEAILGIGRSTLYAKIRQYGFKARRRYD